MILNYIKTKYLRIRIKFLVGRKQWTVIINFPFKYLQRNQETEVNF